jgi:DnaJ-class molecular chaperone
MAENVVTKEVVGQSHESMTCERCNGTGLTGNHVICGACRGFGFTSAKTVPCQHCHGTGFKKSHITCDQCRGFGTLPVK